MDSGQLFNRSSSAENQMSELSDASHGGQTNNIDGEGPLHHGGQNEMADQDHQVVQAVTTHSMTHQEAAWWAMTFDELYKHAKRKNFGKRGKESRKSGRVRIIRWLCEKEGITPYVAAPSVTPPVVNTTTSSHHLVRPTGAVSHPEAILRTSDPSLQRLIDEAEKKYREWPGADLLELANQRSYQLFKDSQGKMPSRSKAALANWLAAWDVLKSNREKKWWQDDGIHLVNKAKAMGYQGPSGKYDVIVWLRTTPEDSEVEVKVVAEPTPNKRSKREAEDSAPQPGSKRRAKGSTRSREPDLRDVFITKNQR